MTEIVWLFVMALPVASASWTVTNEEVFRELREWCAIRARHAKWLVARKACYLVTCQYCFSHWVTAVLLGVTDYRLAYFGWRGSVVAFFATVAVANLYMTIYEWMRQQVKLTRLRANELQPAQPAGMGWRAA